MSPVAAQCQVTVKSVYRYIIAAFESPNPVILFSTVDMKRNDTVPKDFPTRFHMYAILIIHQHNSISYVAILHSIQKA